MVRKAGPAARRRPCFCCLKSSRLQVLLVGLDHLLDHLAAHRAGLAAGQVAVIAFLQVHADLGGGLHLELVHSGLGLGDVQLVIILGRHSFCSFHTVRASARVWVSQS